MKHLRGSRSFVKKPATVLFALSLAISASAPLVGCVGDSEELAGLEQVGSLGLDLDVAAGITLLSVEYGITGNGFIKTGTIDVGDSPTISGTIGGIPAGDGYTLELSATSVEDETVFSGSATFDVVAGQTTAVAIHLVGTSDGGSGSVAVVGTINVGPVIDELTALPLAVLVGGEITLTTLANDADSGPSPLSYAWAANTGTLASPTASSTKLTSDTPGIVTVTVTVSDGELVSQRTTTVAFVDGDEGSGGAPGTGGASAGGGAGDTGAGGELGSGGAGSGGVPGSGGAVGSGGTTGAGGSADEQRGSLALVTTAVAPNTAGVSSTVIQVPANVEPGDIAVVFVLSTGSAALVGSPEGFVTTALAAAQHNLSYGPVGSQTSLTWTSSATATTGATAFFFRGQSIAVEVLGTNQPSGSTFGLDASTQAPAAAFASGYALFGIQLPVSGTPTITTSPTGSWLGPVTDGRQLWSWSQAYVPGPDGFLFPASLGGNLSGSAVKRQARVFVGSPAE